MRKNFSFITRAIILVTMFVVLVSFSSIQAEEQKSWGKTIDLPEGTETKSIETLYGIVNVSIPVGWKVEKTSSYSSSFRFKDETSKYSTCNEFSFIIRSVEEKDKAEYRATNTGKNMIPEPKFIDSYIFKSGDFTVRKDHYMPFPNGNENLQTISIDMLYEALDDTTFIIEFYATGLTEHMFPRIPVMESIAKSITVKPKAN